MSKLFRYSGYSLLWNWPYVLGANDFTHILYSFISFLSYIYISNHKCWIEQNSDPLWKAHISYMNQRDSEEHAEALTYRQGFHWCQYLWLIGSKKHVSSTSRLTIRLGALQEQRPVVVLARKPGKLASTSLLLLFRVSLPTTERKPDQQRNSFFFSWP